MIKCYIILEIHKTILMEHQKDLPAICILKKIQKVKPGEKDLTLRQLQLKHKEFLMLEKLNTKRIQFNIEQLITMMDTSLHTSICHKVMLKNGTKICSGMLDQLNFTEKELQMVTVNKFNMKKTIKLGNKHGKRK